MTDITGGNPDVSAGDNRASRTGTRAVSRRAVLAAGGAGATAALAGCLGGSDDETLTVSTWSGANVDVFEDTIIPMYEDEFDTDIELVGNWTNIVGQLRDSPDDDPPYDLTVGSSQDHYNGAQSDLWEPIRYDNVPNADSIKPAVAANLESDSGVPVAYGVMGYVFDADEIELQLNSWSDLVTEDVDMDLALPGSYFFNTILMGAIAHDQTTRDEELYSEEGHDRIFDTVGEMPVEAFYEGAEDLWGLMSGGTADVAQYFYAYSLLRDDQDPDLNLGFRVPELTLGYVDHYQVARGTSNREEAEEFINFLLREDVQTAYAEEFNLGMANENASHPERTVAEVPIENDEIGEDVIFKQFQEVADVAEDLNDRYTEFTREF